LAPLLAAALFVELSIAILGTGLSSLDSEGPTLPLGFGSPEAIGTLLLERFLIVFEAASMLLLVAAVGAVLLAGRASTGGSSASRPGPPGSGANALGQQHESTGTSSLAQMED
jgi:hypothetical protein